MTPATRLTNMYLAKCGELWPNTVRLWRSNAGAGIGMSTVHQAEAALGAGNIKAGLELLRRPVSFGVSGGCDLTGFLVRSLRDADASDFGGYLCAQFLGVEIKASKGDRVSEAQADFHKFVRDFGGLIVVVRDLDQGIRDLAVHAGEPHV